MALKTPRQVGEQIGCNATKVLLWIASGDLQAVNTAVSATGQRPRWRITEEAIADFLRRRSSAPPSPAQAPAPRRRRSADAAVPEYV